MKYKWIFFDKDDTLIYEGLKGEKLIFPETIKTLEYFHGKGYKMGIISNTTPDLEEALRQLNLAKYFQIFIASSIVGAWKPDSEIFQAALDASGALAKNCIFVDDKSANADAAREMGFTAFQINRGTAENGEWLIKNLEELINFAEGN
jgi:FMN phosphatase YigB (HAD superfamily)